VGGLRCLLRRASPGYRTTSDFLSNFPEDSFGRTQPLVTVDFGQRVMVFEEQADQGLVLLHVGRHILHHVHPDVPWGHDWVR
jgi:hypothetical protein